MIAPDPAPEQRPRNTAGILAACRLRQLQNAVDQQLKTAPWRTLAVMSLLALIWGALFIILRFVLAQMRQSWGLIGVVANRSLIVQFFVVLAVMLTFSNAILTFTSLYGRDEAGHLLSMPVRARHVVAVKWLEGIFLSSWSFFLLGVPLMFAIAATSEVGWQYYPLFLAHFVAFVIMPACVGLLAGWAVAMYAPRRGANLIVGVIVIGVLLLILAMLQLGGREMSSDLLLQRLFEYTSIFQQPYLPSTWTAKGITSAMSDNIGASLFYLVVVLGNALFLSWVTVNVLGGSWPRAFSRAQLGRYRATIRNGWFTTALTKALFWYLPERFRHVVRKDLRGFARDPKQWSQMLIMLGLLVIYVLNLKRLPVDVGSSVTKAMVTFLNLATVSLILATFTSRFVYPLLSLESQQLWLLELLPVGRASQLVVKFLFALTITALSGCGVMALGVRMLELPFAWSAVNLLICFGICLGLSGLSVGIGARFPVLGSRNPARIAAGFGGTINLVLSVVFVCGCLAAAGFLSVRELGQDYELPESLSPLGWTAFGSLFLGQVLLTLGVMLIGIQHFRRLEH